MSDTLKLFPTVILRGITILPGVVAHFDISRERSIHAVEEAMVGEEKIFLISQKNIEAEEPKLEDLYQVGVVAKVKQVIKMEPGVVRVLVEGQMRAEMEFLERTGNYDIAEVSYPEKEESCQPTKQEALARALNKATDKYVVSIGKTKRDYKHIFEAIRDPWELIYTVANQFLLNYEKKQQVLEASTLDEAYETLTAILLNEVEINSIKKEFETIVRTRIDKNQHEYILREELQVIREELGEDTTDTDIDNFRAEAEALDAPENVKEKIKKEIDRFAKLGPGSSESAVSRGYIETLLELPWNAMSKDNNDLKNAKAVLDRDHYGMDKVKERILEFLAVRVLTQKGETPIICLVGPPGTGKTSIARSVASALEKEFIRIHLGGVRDEAEIRGHRRTYVGAMPGRIATGLRNAGVRNPLMLLDEIDKVSNEYNKGDTFSALLEVLDPDQNRAFSDHYVELPIDLSEVLFIATANSVQTIPRPLLDRMEIIEVSSYTENEKVHIAQEHLIAKQLEKNGLKKSNLSIGKRPLEKIIRGYTREAGVRNLERRIGEICRKCAREILEDGVTSVKITTTNLEQYLGKVKYVDKKSNRKNEIGIVRGLAWTSVGGDTLQIEVNVMPGKGDFRLTGKLGDVMKESAQAGISYIRSVSDEYQIDRNFFKEHDIHIHIPEGAVPKDGPSAGITMATAMLSAITKIPVYASVAMTGEITLRGRVLPIGGLKEKLLAAKTAGIKKVLVPMENERDVDEISEEITDGLEIVYVESMDQVLAHALTKKEIRNGH